MEVTSFISSRAEDLLKHKLTWNKEKLHLLDKLRDVLLKMSECEDLESEKVISGLHESFSLRTVELS